MADSVTFVSEIADQQFKQWSEVNKDSFYLNVKGKKAMLHTTVCSHLGDAEAINSARNPKVFLPILKTCPNILSKHIPSRR